MKVQYISILAAFLMLVACHSKAPEGRNAARPEDVADGVAPVSVVDLTELAVEADPDSIRLYAAPLTALLILQQISDTVTEEALTRYAGSKAVAMFRPEVAKIWPDSVLNRRLQAVANRLPVVLPIVKMPVVYTVVWPYNQSVVALGDSAVILALNHYLGAQHPAYNGFAEYVRRHKEPERVAVDLAEAIVSLRFPYDGGSYPTVLSRLLREGAIIEAVMRLTGVDEAAALGFTPDQAEWAASNERQAWETMLNRKMVFSTDADLSEALIAPSPSTSVLNVESPGRLGRFIGHRIVAAYLRSNPDSSLSFILSPEFWNDGNALSKSGY